MPEKRKDRDAGDSSPGASARRSHEARYRSEEAPRGFAFAPINYALFGAALAAIVAGYVLLNRGSVTAAPLLLVLGYILLVPAALLVGLSGRRRGTDAPSNDE